MGVIRGLDISAQIFCIEMDRWVGRVAIVTGASAGIGAAIATSLVKAGMMVVGCARREERLVELSNSLKEEKGKLFPRKCDMRSESEIRAMFTWVEDHPQLGRVDVCVNNAGLSTAETLTDGSMESWRNMLDVNVLALCLCTQLSIHSMTKHGVDDGQIVMISSFSGHRVPPNPSTRFYAATKFAVTGLLEGWRQEMRDLGSNIRVAGVSPGLVETEFQSAMYPEDPARATAITSSLPCLQAQDMADTVTYILSAPKHMQIHDILIRPTQQKS